MIPEHIEQIFSSVVIVKERWIEAAAVKVNWIRPITINARTGDEIIVEIAHGRATRAGHTRSTKTFYIRVNQPEQNIGVGKAWRPDAARIGIAKHVELAGAVQGA